MTRNEVATRLNNHQAQRAHCDCESCDRDRSFLEGYEQGEIAGLKKGLDLGYKCGVRDSANICNKAKRWNGKQNRYESTKTSMELFGLILALGKVKEKA